ncbi:MAG TPA: ComF family protein [Hellea balneolensis]|uniref:ComF family protein n=1 Tax=Hellea balneolensis TaxID=287478 RepID=A0A7C5QQN0_9PROT|nr:ComF family protein [Hellea balneolensis]
MQSLHLSRLSGRIKHLSRQCVDIIWPPHSLLSGKPVKKDDIELWQKLDFLDLPACHRCGYPFEFEAIKDLICGACAAKPPVFDHARAAIEYNDASKKLILDFKHGGYTDGLNFFAAQLHRVGQNMLQSADYLVPVPLHRKRLRMRKFNQSALLSRKLAKYANIPYRTDILARSKNTPSQGGQSYLGRARNVSGAFKVMPGAGHKVKNVHIVLVDDVYTTGATLNACARTLRKAGARQIDVLTLMRVVRPATVAK